MDEFQKNYAAREKADIHEYILYNFIYMKFRTDKSKL